MVGRLILKKQQNIKGNKIKNFLIRREIVDNSICFMFNISYNLLSIMSSITRGKKVSFISIYYAKFNHDGEQLKLYIETKLKQF